MRDSAVYLEITIQIDIWFVCGFLIEKEKKNLSWKRNWNVPPKAEDRSCHSTLWPNQNIMEGSTSKK